MMPEAELVVIDDARHFMPIERPEPFNQALLTFLDRVEARVTGRPAALAK